MHTILRQLHRWRFRERLLRLVWGLARTLAVLLVVLAAACLIDWFIDRYSGSQTWRDWRNSSWLLWPADPLDTGETPFWLVRVPLTAAQLALAAGLLYLWVYRPVRQTPPIDDLAFQAEQAFPVFEHRLVTAVQLNRRGAKIQGMSRALIAQVTAEAEALAQRHDFLRLLDTSRWQKAVAWLLPVLLGWGLFVAINPSLAAVLVLRQALLPLDIPRRIHLENLTPELWPVGADVTVRVRVTGRFQEDMVGVLRLVPDGQPEEFYELHWAKTLEDGSAVFETRLPPMSQDFSFLARLGDGRMREPGRVRFESPPQLAPDDPSSPPLIGEIELPAWLGRRPDGSLYLRRNDGWSRGEIVDALPQSRLRITARFNKPVAQAYLVPILRGEGLREQNLSPLPPLLLAEDRRSAFWTLPAQPRLIAYRLDLTDDYGFTNPLPIRRNIRLWEDRPPIVEWKPESTRDPNRASPDWAPGVNPKDFEWDMPLAPNGRIQVIYVARSDAGIGRVNIAYRVVPRGIPADAYPEEIRRIQHPRDDPQGRVFQRLPLRPFTDNPRELQLGEFILDLGKFEKSGKFGEVELYHLPASDPWEEPPGLVAGGCKNFEIAGLQKRLPDGSWAKLEVGDTVELYVEVYDRLTPLAWSATRRGIFPLPQLAAMDRETLLSLPRTAQGHLDLSRLPPRPAGYPREAKRKFVVTEADAEIAFRLRDEGRQRLREKLQQIAEDQTRVFQPKR
jgi:hypothetical protein